MEVEVLPPGNLPALIPAAVPNVAWLVAAYRSDPLSPYHKKRFATRQNYDSLMRRLVKDCGGVMLCELNARSIHALHVLWGGDGRHIPMAHSLIGMLRTVVRFGATFLESPECAALKPILSDLRFPMAKPRTSALTTEQVLSIIEAANDLGRHSIALAQAGQFSFTFRQKDIIGEIVPADEPGPGIMLPDGTKWMRGIHWGEIDQNFILKHTTSKRNKAVEIDIKLAPLFVKQLRFVPPAQIATRGPLIICEETELPWRTPAFRKTWRSIADHVGIPKNTKNMDSRAGAITEALKLGASLQSVRKTATHSSEAQTQAYSRGDTDEIASVMKLRAKAHERAA